jgi:hypothetical protein
MLHEIQFYVIIYIKIYTTSILLFSFIINNNLVFRHLCITRNNINALLTCKNHVFLLLFSHSPPEVASPTTLTLIHY